MKRKSTFMGVTTEYDPVEDRKTLCGKAERGEITPTGYWANLRASWFQMDAADKADEFTELNAAL